MHSKQFTQEQKLIILKSAAGIGIKEAAKIADIHYTTIYDWRRKLDGLGEERFLAYQPSYPGRGIKVISAEKEAAVLDCWKSNPGFGPGQVRGQLRRGGYHTIDPHGPQTHASQRLPTITKVIGEGKAAAF